MAQFQTRKSSPAAKRATIANRAARAAKRGTPTTTRAGHVRAAQANVARSTVIGR